MKNTLRNAIFGGLIGLAISGIVSAQIHPEIQPEDVDSLYPGKAYSPWAERSFPSRSSSVVHSISWSSPITPT